MKTCASPAPARSPRKLDSLPRRERFDDWDLEHRYEIYSEWRHRYAPGVTHNTEHVFGLRVVKRYTPAACAARASRLSMAALARRRGCLLLLDQCRAVRELAQRTRS